MSSNKKLNADVKDIDNNEIDPRLPSICIPRVDLSVSNEYVKSIINEVLLPINSSKDTCIERIDLINRQNEKGEDYKRVFIHFKPWNSFESSTSKKMRQKLLSGQIIKIMHNYPSYWKCSASRVPRPEWQDPTVSVEKEKPKAYILDDNEKGEKQKVNINKVINKKKTQVSKISQEYKPKWLGEEVFNLEYKEQQKNEKESELIISSEENNNIPQIVYEDTNKEDDSLKKKNKNKKKFHPHPVGNPPPGKIWDSVMGVWMTVNKKN